jgi:hypothetical protein
LEALPNLFASLKNHCSLSSNVQYFETIASLVLPIFLVYLTGNRSPLFIIFSIPTMLNAILIKCLVNERVYGEGIISSFNINIIRYLIKQGFLEPEIVFICKIKPMS